MPLITLELSLDRASGVLAGIVASLGQSGLELQNQKLERATDRRGGWLTITAEGEAPDSAALAERLNATRGVERLMRIEVDGETVFAEGEPLTDQVGPDDLAELSGGEDHKPCENDAAATSHETGTDETLTRPESAPGDERAPAATPPEPGPEDIPGDDTDIGRSRPAPSDDGRDDDSEHPDSPRTSSGVDEGKRKESAMRRRRRKRR